MTGIHKTTPPERNASHPLPAAVEDAKALALAIEEERRKIGELSFIDLTSPAVIHRINKLERLINQYMLINAQDAGRNITKDINCPCPHPRSPSGLSKK